MRPDRLAIVHGALLLFATALVGKAAHVQLWQGNAWAARADRQQFTEAETPAPRGAILDTRGIPLAESRELVQLSIAPKEATDLRAVQRALIRLGADATWVRRNVTARRPWVVVPGRFFAADASAIVALRGVHVESVLERTYTRNDGARRLVGQANGAGVGVDGIEYALDSLLRGTPGRRRMLRDARGRRFESPNAPATPPVPGHTVVLTLNHELQDIADRALTDAVTRMHATGGDIVVLDPHDGAVLAMASRRPGAGITGSPALTEPFEPGSTLKPFLAARLLELGRARADETIETFNGTYELNGRTITDVHRASQLTLRDVIAWSSNVGIVRFAERLTPGETYQTLRDVGFGTPTGLPYPSEAAGTLREPRLWSAQSAASLAMGYEIAVTPVQLAAAYASIANGGELVEPALVREIRAPDGEVVYRHRRRVVRRVMPAAIAAELRAMLTTTVREGTAVQADVAGYEMGGKTGTARRVSAGGYTRRYTASFVGLFPAEDPQYVILVKLDDPTGDYYGGKTAAPVSRVVIEAALAARDAALDRSALASRPRPRPVPDDARRASVAAETTVAALTEAPVVGTGSVPHVYALTAPPARRAPRPTPRAVPDVRGLTLRGAVHALHVAGFRVQLVSGSGGETLPAAGALAAPGTVVRLARR